MPSITFSARVHAKLSEPWKNSVVVKLLGRTIGYRALCARLNVMWKSAMGFSLIDLENNYYLVRFRSVGEAMDALTKGPWLIMGQYLTVQPWTPSFDFTNANLDQVTVWICLPGLAVHLYNRKVLQKLGQLVGNVIKIDSNTASSSRGRFARLALSISLTRPLVSQFELDGKIQKVEYEGLPVICYKCRCYGHNSSNCKDAKSSTSHEDAGQPQQAVPENEAPGQQAVGSNGDNNVELFGPWMIATRRGRKPNIGQENTGNSNRNREFTGAARANNSAKTMARRKPQNKAVVARNQSRKPNVPVTATCNPLQPSAFSTREKEISILPHANRNFEPHIFPQKVSSNQLVAPFATTLDPSKHTVFVCSSQTFPNGDERDVTAEHIERQGPNPQQVADPPDDQTIHRGNEGDSAHNHPVVPMNGVDGDGLVENEVEMVQETPLAWMDDVLGQQQ
ncbi:hypothetical protein WN944_000342 [Citrus x changshan-huyou]|uniref:DUF4283 domain-containing protein n=1 Tax=Citrus x changshan-huyou TaxID=2935761 RepID=A0AAP0MHP3_9ROSI